jgi:hypothetical protein
MGQYGHLIIGAVNEAEKALLPNKLMITMTQTMALPFTTPFTTGPLVKFGFPAHLARIYILLSFCHTSKSSAFLEVCKGIDRIIESSPT